MLLLYVIMNVFYYSILIENSIVFLMHLTAFRAQLKSVFPIIFYRDDLNSLLKFIAPNVSVIRNSRHNETFSIVSRLS